MSCAQAAVRDAAADPLLTLRARPRRIALIGNANVGKSVLFGRLTGQYAVVSNYPGTTVAVTRGRVVLGGEVCELIDTPGVTALVPGFLPDGYELSNVAVAARSKVMIGTEEGDESYFGRHVFALQYKRGFDWLAVSTRAMRDGDYNVDTDLCEGYDQPWSKLARVEAPITSGAFAGVTARIVAASTSSPPHLWAMKDGVLLTVAGAATADELLEVAESLQAHPGSSPAAE